ncbi:MAG: hypothetical protein NWE94_01910 [Candidatus Bathyarchaeota archaeon]|nr:hypothetical protein [Candidatus Bathyarchaeota archaeon]
MKNFLRNKRALGTSVANLIVITATVLLSLTVTTFAMNITASQVQKESMYIASSHIWYVNSTYSIGAIAATNTGPTDIVLTRLVIKGMQCAWNGETNFVVYCKEQNSPGDLPFVANLTREDNVIAISNSTYTFTATSEGLTLKSGWTIMFYIVIPECIMVYDLGTPVRITLATTQAVYCTETNVQTS